MTKNCCKYFTVSLVPVASLTLAVVFGLGIVVLPILYVHLAESIRYGIVIDAGSSHTDIYVYKWPIPKDAGTASITQIGFCKDDRSLNSYNRTPDQAGGLFKNCLQDIQTENDLPHSDTELFLGATAGMRLVKRNNRSVSEAIMRSANDSLKQNYTYIFNSGRIISGKEEATGGWITANYASKRLKKSNEPLMGALDLGGASAEIAFQYQPHGGPQSEYEVTVELFGEKHNLYARSYLCFGQNEARWRLLAHLTHNSGNGSHHILNPCMLDGATMTFSEEEIFSSVCVQEDTSSDVFGFGYPPPSGLLSSGNSTNYTFVGTGDPQSCNDTIVDVFSVTNCSDKSICVNTSYMYMYLWPPVNNSGTFMGMSGFYYAARFFNSSDRDLHDLGNFNTSVWDFCSLDYSTALHLHPSDSHLQERCFDGLFSLFLLETAFGFNSTSKWTLYFQGKVHDLTVGWAMGYLLNQTNSIPNSPHQVQRPFTAVDLIVGIIVLSILCLVFVVFFFLTFHACRKVLKTRGGYSHIS